MQIHSWISAMGAGRRRTPGRPAWLGSCQKAARLTWHTGPR